MVVWKRSLTAIPFVSGESRQVVEAVYATMLPIVFSLPTVCYPLTACTDTIHSILCQLVKTTLVPNQQIP